jgi:hypothetical protein
MARTMNLHQVALSLVLVPLFGCATTPQPAKSAARLEVATLCDRLTARACSAEGRAAAPEDLATLVVGSVADSDAAFAAVVNELTKVEPTKRKAALIKAVSDAGGAPWSCEAFDAMWASQRVSCSQ